MVAEAVAEDLRRRGHEAFLFFCDTQFDTPDKHGYYSQPDRYYIWRFPVQGEEHVLPTFPLMISDPNPRNFPGAWTFRDLSDELLEFYFRAARRELEQAIAGFRPDIVECQHVWTMSYLVNELGLPYVATAHHTDQVGYRNDRRMQLYANRAAAGARWLFAISEFVRREVLSLYPGLSQEKVVLLENGYDQRIFHAQRVSRARVLRKLGLEDVPGLPIISFAGKISRTKGVDILLQANRVVQRQCPALLVLAGTGQMEEFTPEEQATFHFENVRLVGHQPQAVIAQLHNLATVSVMPSRTEGYGIAALEAMGCGTPVVGTRSGGPESFVVGDLVSVGSVEELAASLLKLLNLKPQVARELRQTALEKARQHSWEEIVERRLRYYREALGD
jgi:glycosyltransferase involved in cell wall biosynthesis